MMDLTYVNRDSVFHGLDPRSKIFWLLLVSFLATFSGNVILILLIYVHNLFVWFLLSRLPGKTLISYNLRFGLMIFIICLFVSFFDTLNIYTSTWTSLIITIKWLIVILSAITFSMTTNPQDIVSALVKMRIPKSFAFTLGIGLRMLPLMMEEVNKISKAQKARGFDTKIKLRNIHKIHSIYIPLLMPLLVSTIKMIDEIVIALESRGFSMDNFNSSPFIRINNKDVVLILILSAILLGFFLF